jgi:hypothetical protein
MRVKLGIKEGVSGIGFEEEIRVHPFRPRRAQ